MVSMEFFIHTIGNRPHCGPGFNTTSDRNNYQEYFLWGRGGWWVGLTTLPHSYADCLEIWEPQPSGTLRVCNMFGQELLYFACFGITKMRISQYFVILLFFLRSFRLFRYSGRVATVQTQHHLPSLASDTTHTAHEHFLPT